MKEPRPDDERLAALLEGRLVGPERDELLAYLATADEDLLVFAKTAAVLREMEEEEATQAAGVQADPPPRPEVLPPSTTKSARGWPRRTPRWAAIPAVLVGLVALVLLVRPGPSAPADPARWAASARGQKVPADWERKTPWVAARGDDSPSRDTAGAVRAGVFLLRLAIAIQAGDAEATATLALQTQERFDPHGGSALNQIQARADQPSDSLQPLLKQATKRLQARWEPDYLRLGAWTEAARLAANRQDAAFFRAGDTRAMLRSAERLTEGDARARAALAAVRAELPPQEAPKWKDLEANLTVFLREIAT